MYFCENNLFVYSNDHLNLEHVYYRNPSLGIFFVITLCKYRLVGCLFWFYGISTFEGYLTPNPFL